MKNKTAYIIAAAILIAGGLWAYKTLKAHKDRTGDLTKEQAITLIVSNSKHNSAAFLNTLETGYLKAWAKAVMAKDAVFSYMDNKFNTSGGTSVKKT